MVVSVRSSGFDWGNEVCGFLLWLLLLGALGLVCGGFSGRWRCNAWRPLLTTGVGLHTFERFEFSRAIGVSFGNLLVRTMHFQKAYC